MDPGPHDVRFAWKDGASVDRRVLATEGQKAILVTGVHPLATAVSATIQTPTHLQAHDGLRTAGYVAGATGVVALGVGTVLGIVTIVDAEEAKSDCVPAGNCSANRSAAAANGMHTAAALGDASTGLFITAGALITASVIAITRPHAESRHAVSAAVGPTAGVRGALLSLRGTW